MDSTSTNEETPKTLVEAIRYFSDPDNCLRLLIPLVWPAGVTCPRCQSKENSFLATRRLWKCKTCKKQFSIKVGTIMEDSPLGLDKWLTGMWLIVNAKNGISSYEIHRALGITQKSAWFMLHRIRLAMQNGSMGKIGGEVEVDETYIGGKVRNMHASKRAEKIHGRGGVGNAIVLGILERGGKVKTTVIPNTKKRTIQPIVHEAVEAGACISTDSLLSYEGLSVDYVHEAVDHAAQEYVRGNIHTNGLENYWSLLKRCIKRTYVNVEPFHLFRYLDEEAFRLNERKHANGEVKKDGERFRDVATGIAGKRLTYKKLTGNEGHVLPPAP